MLTCADEQQNSSRKAVPKNTSPTSTCTKIIHPIALGSYSSKKKLLCCNGSGSSNISLRSDFARIAIQSRQAD
eukprot:181433-Amphidinium_carterae.1